MLNKRFWKDRVAHNDAYIVVQKTGVLQIAEPYHCFTSYKFLWSAFSKRLASTPPTLLYDSQTNEGGPEACPRKSIIL